MSTSNKLVLPVGLSPLCSAHNHLIEHNTHQCNSSVIAQMKSTVNANVRLDLKEWYIINRNTFASEPAMPCHCQALGS